MKIRTVIVDDEPLARERISKLLGGDPEIELAGEASNGREALKVIQREKPDLLFLDVQMPELNGFGVLEKLDSAHPAAVVFVTAYDKFALKAFEVHAVDYLLKPFDRDRFQLALERVKQKIRGAGAAQGLDPRVTALLSQLRQEGGPQPDRLAIKKEGRVLLLKFQEIDWLESEGNYVKVHAGREVHVMREKLSGLETRLPLGKFVRISRSALVNLDRVRELQPLFHGDCSVLLADGTTLTVSRNHRSALEKSMI